MKKLIASLSVATMLIAGCGTNKEDKNDKDEYTFPSQEEKKELLDDKITNPNVIKHDELLYIGDIGLDSKIKQIQNPPSEDELRRIEQMQSKGDFSGITNIHHSWKYPQLHPVFPNQAVKPINGDYVNNVIGKAWDYFGTPYEYGADRNQDKTFDCSSFTRWVHLWTLGMDLPKTSRSQWEYVKQFSKRSYTDLSQAKRGDLLFFMNYQGWQKSDYNGIDVKSQPIGHVGIYLGNGYMIHTASAKTGGVRYDKIKGTHLEYRFVGGGQVVQ